ncbi:MAG: lipopolysaccharide kinase InaA family protein [Candidatus Gastranaerophilaceae bacterium]
MAEVIKYFDPESEKIFAIKRVFSPDKAKHQTANPVEQAKIEAQIYEKVKKIKRIPEFYYYNGNSGKNENSILSNYLIISWVDGKSVSKGGALYDFSLITNHNIKQLFSIMSQMDKAGIVHNDLWAGNLLFTPKNVNVIDFNRSYEFNPLKDISDNNLHGFKKRFLYCYFSDLYKRQGEETYLKKYKDCLKIEIDYYKNKQLFYLTKLNKKGLSHYRKLENGLKQELKNPELMKQDAIKIVFNSDLDCFQTYARYFEFEENEAGFHCQKALRVLNNHPEIVGSEKANLLKSNFIVTSNLNNVLKLHGESKIEKINKILCLLNNEAVYTKAEREKPYYELFKRFCEFNIKYRDLLKQGRDTGDLRQEYSDLYKIKRLNTYFANLQD